MAETCDAKVSKALTEAVRDFVLAPDCVVRLQHFWETNLRGRSPIAHVPDRVLAAACRWLRLNVTRACRKRLLSPDLIGDEIKSLVSTTESLDLDGGVCVCTSEFVCDPCMAGAYELIATLLGRCVLKTMVKYVEEEYAAGL